jgi:acylaminoacyl-peptidase
MNIRWTIVLVIFSWYAPGTVAQPTPFTYDDLITLDRISGLQVNKDGRYAIFNVRSTDLERNKGVHSLWLKDLRSPTTPERRLAVSDSVAVGAQWGPDGTSIYFLSPRGGGGTMQVWRTDLEGSSAQRITQLPLDVGSFRPTPDGGGLIVALAVIPEITGDEIESTVARNSTRPTGSGTAYYRLFVRHWDAWADGTRNHLFHVAFSDGKVTALTQGFDGDIPSKPFGDEQDFWIAPDGRTVYFSAREAGTTEPWSTNFDIYSVPTTGGPPTNLTAANQAWDAAPRVSPDGRTLAYKAMKRPGFEADRYEVQLRELSTGRVRALATTWDRSVEQLAWSADGRSLFVTADDLGRHRLFRIDVKTGSVMPLSAGGHIDAFRETPKGFVFLKSAMNSPATLYLSGPLSLVTGGAMKNAKAMIDDGAVNLTTINAHLADKIFGEYEQFTFPGWNNETVHGYVVKPAGFSPGRKYPVAFLIHGGPQGSFGDIWTYRWNAMSYAGAGYAVVMIDFHGSTGYGQAFTDAISTHWGDRPLEDLQKGWSYALANYRFLDGDRAAALGASYGGFMVNWIAGRWKEPWKCLVSHDGVFDARSMGYTTEELWFEEWDQGASAFTDPAAYDRFNPALHAKDWSVPMLVIHSDLDYRIPVEQGIAAFTALQARGVPSQFLRFPDENHWVLKPRNSMQWHATVFGWLERYIGTGAGAR